MPGWCKKCKARRASNGNTKCGPCFKKFGWDEADRDAADRANAAVRERYHQALVAGKCVISKSHGDACPGHSHCPPCIDLRFAAKMQRLQRPPPAMSFMKALVLHAPFIQKIFKVHDLPNLDAVYMDSENSTGTDSGHFRLAAYSHEFSFWTLAQGWELMLRHKGELPMPKKMMRTRSQEMKSMVEGRQIVYYARGHCDRDRMRDHWQYLPKGESPPDYDLYDADSKIAKLIFTTDPKCEHDPKAPIYMPMWPLAYLASYFQTTPEERTPFALDWQYHAHWRDAPAKGKSVPDTCFLIWFVDMVRHVANGGTFGH